MDKSCQVFTPKYIVQLMLDQLQYTGNNIKTKTILEPSFGDGAFLIEIVHRILDYSVNSLLTREETTKILDNVYGLELDRKYYDIAITRLNKLISQYNIQYDWKNLVCSNALTYHFPVNFDLIVANPPYLKIKLLDMETRKIIQENYRFGKGNTDLYVVFFDLCLKMINPNGKMSFITPNSYFKNTSQKKFRQYISENHYISEIIDYANVDVFENVLTYTAITFMDFAKKNEKTKYTLMLTENEEAFSVTVDLSKFGNNPWTFANEEDTRFLKRIDKRNMKLEDLCDIQHGISTNADAVYVVDQKVSKELEGEILRNVVKGATLQEDKKIIFPYIFKNECKKYMAMEEEELKRKYPKTYKYMSKHRQQLEKRDMEKNTVWFQYARSQGIQNSNNKKIVLKHILSNDRKTCEIKEVDEKTLVYSGIYIVVKDEKNYDFIKNILMSEEFYRYLYLVGKNMAGGYKNVSAKLVKNFGIQYNNQK